MYAISRSLGDRGKEVEIFTCLKHSLLSKLDRSFCIQWYLHSLDCYIMQIPEVAPAYTGLSDVVLKILEMYQITRIKYSSI